MLSLFPDTHWTARGVCEPCGRKALVICPITHDRIVEVLNCGQCDNPMVWSSNDTSQFGMQVWAELTKTVTIKTGTPDLEMTLED